MDNDKLDALRKRYAEASMFEIHDPQMRAVALTTQRATVINLDRAGKPLRPAILWLDQRRLDELPSMGPIVRTLHGPITSATACADLSAS